MWLTGLRNGSDALWCESGFSVFLFVLLMYHANTLITYRLLRLLDTLPNPWGWLFLKEIIDFNLAVGPTWAPRGLSNCFASWICLQTIRKISQNFAGLIACRLLSCSYLAWEPCPVSLINTMTNLSPTLLTFFTQAFWPWRWKKIECKTWFVDQGKSRYGPCT